MYFSERGSGSPLLFVHGLIITGDIFESIVEHFALRHWVIIPDLRGLGKSRELPPRYTVKQLASDLSNLLDHLGIDSAAILGYSHGGAIAQQLVLDNPKRCSSLILVCTYAYSTASFREKIEGHLVPILIRILGMKKFAKFVISQGLKSVTKKRHDWVVGLIAQHDVKQMISAWSEAMKFDSRHLLHEIKCPTLIIEGANDNAVPIHHAKMLHDGIT